MSGLLGGIIGAAIGGIGNIIGGSMAASGAADAAKITAQSNEKATKMILDAQKEARDELRAAANRGLGYIDTGTAKYAETVEPLLTPRPIMLPTYRGLTPQQQMGQQDLVRGIQGQLATSGLRGAGRAGVGVGLDQLRRYLADARAANDADARGELRRASGVADASRTGLASVYANQGPVKANTELMTGSNIASNLSQGGQLAGQLAQSSGLAGANAANAQGQIWGNVATNTAKLIGQGIGGVYAAGASPNAGGGAGYDPSGEANGTFMPV